MLKRESWTTSEVSNEKNKIYFIIHDPAEETVGGQDKRSFVGHFGFWENIKAQH